VGGDDANYMEIKDRCADCTTMKNSHFDPKNTGSYFIGLWDTLKIGRNDEIDSEVIPGPARHRGACT
jgi:hypothetical protein